MEERMEHTGLLRNTVMVQVFIPVLQWKTYKSTRELHSTFQLWDPNNECLHFAKGEYGYQKLGNEIPQRLFDRAPRKTGNGARSGYTNYYMNLSVSQQSINCGGCLCTVLNNELCRDRGIIRVYKLVQQRGWDRNRVYFSKLPLKTDLFGPLKMV